MSYLYPPPQFALRCVITSSTRTERTDIPVNSPVFYSITVNNPVGYNYLINPNPSFQGQDQVQVGLDDVKIGDWIGTQDGQGVAFLIVEKIDLNTYTIADIDGWCLRVRGGPTYTQGDVCIFRVNEDSIPMFGNLSLGGGDSFFSIVSGAYDPLQWVADMVGRFASRNNKTQYVSIYQSVAKTITGASITGARTLYDVADTSGLSVGNTVIIEGIELGSATGYNGTGSIHAIDPNVSVTVNITSSGTPESFGSRQGLYKFRIQWESSQAKVFLLTIGFHSDPPASILIQLFFQTTSFLLQQSFNKLEEITSLLPRV